MAQTIMRIGTRESQLAVWQATQVQSFLKAASVTSELVYIKSEGDVDTVTPLYALGVQGVFTKALDAALLNNRIDIAVHSMKDVPTQLAQGIKQAAVLKRASHKDIFVYKNLESIKEWRLEDTSNSPLGVGGTIATSSIRRIAQWLHRYPNHKIENLRGNVNTRLRKMAESSWNGAIFAAAGLERINVRPQSSIDLDWMLPAPAQGAIMVVCRDNDQFAFDACQSFHHADTALCTKIERDFLSTLMGGCSTPISALAEVKGKEVVFRGNLCSTDGKEKIDLERQAGITDASELGVIAAN
ncbi:MAG: hydroxymethylbilane synthase, partial [Flavisolibacter sp.]|nr:hydroxymethylbilane synthase [Flavisolibacter sp.]